MHLNKERGKSGLTLFMEEEVAKFSILVWGHVGC